MFGTGSFCLWSGLHLLVCGVRCNLLFMSLAVRFAEGFGFEFCFMI